MSFDDQNQISESNSDEFGEYAEVESPKLYPGQILKGTRLRMKDYDGSRIFPRPENNKYAKLVQECFAQATALPSLDLTPRDVTRWKMAWREIQNHSNIIYPGLFIERCKDWPEIEDMLKLPIALTFSATALIYGGLHALAWHAYFKSPTEQLLWRISACIVMGGMPLILLAAKFKHTLLKSFYFFTKFIHRDLYDYLYLSLVLLLFSAYVLARAYLVVECFINLAHLPAEVYDVPSWASYFPHIS